MKYSMMDFDLSDDYVSRVNKYLEEGLSNGNIVKVGNHYFDLKSLSIPVNLDCLNCEKVCDINCCGGAPYPPQQESLEFIKKHFDEIFSDPNAGDPDDRVKLNKLLMEKNFTVNFGNRRWQPGAIKKTKGMETFPIVHENGCIFNVKDGDKHKCAIHAHCLTCGINPIEKKPIYCSMYPLCSIDINDESKFIFCILDKDITFNMWQGIDFSVRPCFNKGLLTDPNREYFKDEDYKTSFESSYNSVVYLLKDEEVPKQVLSILKERNNE